MCVLERELGQEENGKGGGKLSLWMHTIAFHHELSNVLLAESSKDTNPIPNLSNTSLA